MSHLLQLNYLLVQELYFYWSRNYIFIGPGIEVIKNRLSLSQNKEISFFLCVKTNGFKNLKYKENFISDNLKVINSNNYFCLFPGQFKVSAWGYTPRLCAQIIIYIYMDNFNRHTDT